MGKIYERIILHRLEPILTTASIIPQEQFGFMPKRSTTHQLLRLTKQVSQGFNSRLNTMAIFLDIHRAYDATWHKGLLYKFRTIQLPRPIQLLLKSFLEDGTFQVKSGAALSSTRPVRAGVPQGAVLPPTLYNINTADVPNNPQNQLALYADDIAIFTQG